jgi:hypothetical protein
VEGEHCNTTVADPPSILYLMKRRVRRRQVRLATERARRQATTVTTTTTETTATSTTQSQTSKTVTQTSTTSTTETQTSTTIGCVGSLYQGPIVKKKGINTFRIAAAFDVPLEQCLAECTADVNCAGISHIVGGNIHLQLLYFWTLRHISDC